MARYRTLLVGVFDNETQQTVTTMDHPEWETYLAWLAAGNSPDPYEPPQEPEPPPEVAPVPMPAAEITTLAMARNAFVPAYREFAPTTDGINAGRFANEVPSRVGTHKLVSLRYVGMCPIRNTEAWFASAAAAQAVADALTAQARTDSPTFEVVAR